jgi:hypothetical protein
VRARGTLDNFWRRDFAFPCTQPLIGACGVYEFSYYIISFLVRMFCCKQHIIYTSEHITRTVSTTVYGIYIFWLQGIYTWESLASTWVHPRLFGGSVLLICLDLCGVFLFCLSFVCVENQLIFDDNIIYIYLIKTIGIDKAVNCYNECYFYS